MSRRACWILFALVCFFSRDVKAQVRFELGSATARPGESDVSLPLSIHVDPGIVVTGYSVVVRYDPSVLGNANVELVRPADLSLFGDPSGFTEPGTVWATATFYAGEPPIDPDLLLTEANDGIVANLKFCILER